MKVILCGGGSDIQRVMKGVSDALRGQSVAYVAIAAEPNAKLIKKIRAGSTALSAYIESLGATSASILESSEFDQMFRASCVILSGGSTEYLLRVLQEKNFKDKLRHSDVKVIIGISAGAIALAKEGIGTKNGERYTYQGLGYYGLKVAVPSATAATGHDLDSEAKFLPEYEYFASEVPSPIAIADPVAQAL